MLRNECKELKQRLEGAQHQLEDSETKNSELNAQNFSMKQQLPNFSWDSTVFRHQKHKEFLLELHEINKKYQLGIKEKVDDMRHYIKVYCATLTKSITYIEQRRKDRGP